MSTCTYLRKAISEDRGKRDRHGLRVEEGEVPGLLPEDDLRPPDVLVSVFPRSCATQRMQCEWLHERRDEVLW